MAIVSKDEIMKQVKELLKDNTSDEAIALIENVNDTLDSLGDSENVDALNKKITELEQTVKDTEEKWRTKYTERFYSGTDDKTKIDDPSVNNPSEKDDKEDNTPETFDDLFSTSKGD